MSEADRNASSAGPLAPYLARLGEARWVVATAAVAVFAVAFFSPAPWWLIAAAVLAIVAVAALLPRRSRRSRRRGAQAQAMLGPVEGLSAERLAAAVPDPLILFDQSGRIAHANRPAQTAFGAVQAGVDVRLRFRSPEMQELVRALLAGNVRPSGVDYAERVPVERHYHVNASSVGSGTGLFVLVFKDQSELRRVDRMRADFIANASHELRTPLASISGFVETLRGPARDDPKARDRFLDIMNDQTARMARLIDDLLSLSRLEMKSFIGPDERVDICLLVRGVIDSLTQLAREAGVEIVSDIPEGPIEVPGNRDELIQVFENLLENACKYGQSGKKVEIAVARVADDPKGGAEITVRDFGPGIPDEHIPRITERFYRVDVEESRAQKGTGLGLAIVKHILSRHNARLTIRSVVGEGAAFTVHLPGV
ncbi:MAG: two-component sensor histidine kinase [Rhizobiaceae bacterium]|nr:two-component sensor histidine kinase [Rhizobiaceae bacterium]